MRKIINSTYITLDGVVENPHLWPSLGRPRDDRGQGHRAVRLRSRLTAPALAHGLLDELRLWIHPLILGQGTPADLLFGAVPSVGFRLADATTLSDGIVSLSYDKDEALDLAAA
jgi:hypothetical protein